MTTKPNTYMRINREEGTLTYGTIIINNQEFEIVDNFKYLRIGCKNDKGIEINQKIQAGH